ncbi:MAG: VOC family protein [Bacteroidia bacterium]|nr:VOC family protein [Bacteroidia bacterium]MCF8427685.1 VOC family protein [Bacteroidia bacterium]MCF8447377.1 VOC family protein [Bacteroidia bacterium]
MTQLISYLTFNGNCREAMTFYQECLGGELHFQTLGESPLSAKMPKKMKSCILHSSLSKGNIKLMGTDMVGERGLLKGNNISLSLSCSSEEEIKEIFTKLSLGGNKNQALEHTFWNTIFGNLTDKFGIHWLLQFDKNKK